MRDTYWYIEPTQDLTNEQLVALLAQAGLAAEATCAIRVCNTPVPAYRVPFRFVTMFERSSEHRAHLRVFVQEGNGKVRRWNLAGKARKRVKAQKAVRAVALKLKKRGPKHTDT